VTRLREEVLSVARTKDQAKMQAIAREPQHKWQQLQNDLAAHRWWRAGRAVGEVVALSSGLAPDRSRNPIHIHVYKTHIACSVLLHDEDMHELQQIAEPVSVSVYGVVTAINPFTQHLDITSIWTTCDGSE
jgi:hypothetical protein